MKTYRYTAYRQMTPWEATKAWSAKRKVMRQEFESRQSEATSALTDAMANNASGAGELAAKMAVARIEKETKAKQADAARAAESAANDTTRADLYESKFSDSSSAKLDSGTSIDLSSNTLTLSNGTVIDIKTGVKKVNVTV
jgi:hypothetical protein